MPPAQGLGQHILVESFASGHLGCQDQSALFPVFMPNLIDQRLAALGSQLATAPRAVLGAKLAVQKPEEMVDFGESCHRGAAAGMADALLNGYRGWKAGDNVYLGPLKDPHVLSHIWGKAFKITALTLGK